MARRYLYMGIPVLIVAITLIGCSDTPEPPAIGLYEAAITGDVEAVRQHIEAGSDLNVRAADDATPLITAAAFGNTEVAEALIEAEADLNLRNNVGSTALITAAFLCRVDIVRFLLDHGADRSLKNNDGATALDSVSGPFEQLKGAYDIVQAALGPLGLDLDYEYIEATRPKIAEMLR